MTLTEIVEAMSKVNALVIGDGITDRYVFCRAERLCPEGPVPVAIPERIENRHGGAMNVADQMRALGVSTEGLHGYPLSCKTRYMVGHQLLLRVDEDNDATLDPNDGIAVFCELVGKRKVDVIVLSDYLKGTLTPELCQYAIKFANDNGIPVVVDPKGSDWSKYAGCDWLCPNEHELKVWNGQPASGKLLTKRGAEGLRISDSHGVRNWPATARRVFDVTGAGDTVVAVVAAVLAAGGSIDQAAAIANLAAGYVVGEVGTTVCPKDKLLELCK